MPYTTHRARHRMTALGLALSTSLLSLLSSATFATPSYLEHPKFQTLVSEMASENFSEQELESLFKDVTRQNSIIKAMERPAEKTMIWGDYRKIFVTDKRARQGVDFWKKHDKTLERASQRFQVPKHIIVAIIGVETSYGRIKGSFRVLDALSTLAFDYPPRSGFFYKELKHFLTLSREANIDPIKAKGSYAGAMGYPQFIPSSYRHYAVDFDEDNTTDLINNPVDAIGSVANYFKVHGWENDQPVILRAATTANADENALQPLFNKQLKPFVSVAEVEALGLKLNSSSTAYQGLAVTPRHYRTKKGDQHWLGFNNFYVITRYNRSPLYALAVFQLSERILELANGELANKELANNE